MYIALRFQWIVLYIYKKYCKYFGEQYPLFVPINVREYPRGNKKRTIQRNWQHKVHKTMNNKTKTQHNMCWTPLYANKDK